MINRLVSELQGCDVYINDVIVCSDTWDLHVKQLKAYTVSLLTMGCSLEYQPCEELGEVQPVFAKVQAIVQFPAPTNKHKLMRYLELLTTLLRKNEPFI